MKHKIDVVRTLLDALPFIKKFSNEKIVVKYGGAAQTSAELKEQFAQDIVLLHLVGMKPVIVHGGGKSITQLLADLGVDTTVIDGQRVTTKEVMRIVEMVLSGEINKEIVSLLDNHGAKAVGISGKDGGFLKGMPKDFENFGYTGLIEDIDPEIVLCLSPFVCLSVSVSVSICLSVCLLLLLLLLILFLNLSIC